jgi:hypothetical protein
MTTTVATTADGMETTMAITTLRTAHLKAAATAADVDLDDARCWAMAGDMVSAASSAAYDMAAVLTGQRPTTTATEVPPVVRVRELATAQRQLFRALDSLTDADQRVAERARESASHVGRLGQGLGCLTRSAASGSR